MHFLEQIANYYLRKHREDLGRYTFVFPNRRSAMFMRKYLREKCESVTFLPRLVTLNSFLQQYSDGALASTPELVFVLYNAYLNVLSRRGSENNTRDFDSFLHWGQMAVSDFNDIDAALVDAACLFKNNRDLKTIQANYLTPEQIEVARILGDTRPHNPADVDNFWEHVPGKEKEMANQFLNLWEILEELYEEYHSLLHRHKITSTGLLAKQAHAKVKQMTESDFHGKRFAFVGFSKLPTSIVSLLKHMQSFENPVADFFWDTASPFLHLDGSKAGSIILPLSKALPMPDDFVLQSIVDYPCVEVYPVPSYIGQLKLVPKILNDWSKEIGSIDNTDTAIILPNDDQLVPLLYSLPEKFANINVAMQVPFAQTPFANMLGDILLMHVHARTLHGETTYFYKDVLSVLSYPYMPLISADQCTRLRQEIIDKKLYNIPLSIIREFDRLHPIFHHVDGSNMQVTTDYLDSLIACLRQGLQLNADNKGTAASYEEKILTGYEEAINQICTLSQKYNIDFQQNTYFDILKSMLRIQVVQLSGDPVHGMQILDNQSAKCLDFSRLVVTSMNEGSIPKANRHSSLIPVSLKYGFGLPNPEEDETEEAYQFYRLLARATKLSLLYDNRTPDISMGEVSRFVTQIKLLKPDRYHEHADVQGLGLSLAENREISIVKTPRVMRDVNELRRQGGSLNFSASSLKVYIECPLKFYLSAVKKLKVENFDPEYMDPASYGTIMHSVAEDFYRTEQKRCDDAFLNDHLKVLLSDSKALERRLRVDILRQMQQVYYKNIRASDDINAFPGEARVLCRIMAKNLLSLIQWDATNEHFAFIEGEDQLGRHTHRWKLTPELTVNFTMSIDRIDRLDAEGEYLRFIDYKSGGDETKVSSLQEIFEKKSGKAIFQLLLYCVAYRDLMGYSRDIQPIIYKFSDIAKNEQKPIKIGKDFIRSYLDRTTVNLPAEDGTSKPVEMPISDFTRSRVVEMVREIFDVNTDFTQTTDLENCRYCSFLNICGRVVPPLRN